MKRFMLIISIVFFFACNGSNKTDDQSGVAVHLLDEVGLEQLLTQRSGKILFLNVWATWCVPCREEFPDLVKLVEVYSARNIEFVGLSVDYPDEADSKVIPFLQDLHVNFKIYIQQFERQETLINRLNEDWRGALPASFIFDRSGQIISFLPGKHDFKTFSDEIEKFIL